MGATSYTSYALRLNSKVELLGSQLEDLLDKSKIQPKGPEDFAAGLATVGYWVEDSSLIGVRQKLLSQVKRVREDGHRLMVDALPEVSHSFASAVGQVYELLRRDGGMSTPGSIEEAQRRTRAMVSEITSAIDAATSNEAAYAAVIVADTCVYAMKPKIEDHFELAGISSSTPASADKLMAFIPQRVLSELDKKKDEGQTWAKSATRRLKGLREQGNIVDGVKIQGHLWAMGEGAPPGLAALSPGLSPDRGDDMILASVMKAEIQFPTSPVVFVSADATAITRADFFGLNRKEV